MEEKDSSFEQEVVALMNLLHALFLEVDSWRNGNMIVRKRKQDRVISTLQRPTSRSPRVQMFPSYNVLHQGPHPSYIKGPSYNVLQRPTTSYLVPRPGRIHQGTIYVLPLLLLRWSSSSPVVVFIRHHPNIGTFILTPPV